MKKSIAALTFAALSTISMAPIASAENWVTVVTSDFDGKSYEIDLDSRKEYISRTGWRHVTFRISSVEDKHWYRAIAACNPYQIYVPLYGWSWESSNVSYSAHTVGGKLSRAACRW
jgi:hypothetical protein